MTIQLADGRKTFLDFREKAPLAATRDMYLDAHGNVIQGLSTDGHLAVGVPGTRGRPRVRAREVRHAEARRADRAGDRARRARLRARRRATSTCFATATDDFRKDPATAAIFLKRRRAVRGRATGWCRRTSATTLRAIAAARRRRLLQGPGRRRRSWPSSQAGKGIITQADLDQYNVARARADRMRLPRLPRRLRAAAELGRRGHLRDPQHPRGLSAQGPRLPLGAGGALPDRGDAPRLRRPQQLSRRSRTS